MALSGIEIYKLLPKTNCKKCGFPTCLAFAMKLAQKGVELSACTDVSEEAKRALTAASRPPIQLVSIGVGPRAFSVGNDTVLFRHEKTFVNPTALAVRVKTSQDRVAIARTVSAVNDYAVEWAGTRLRFNAIAIQDDGNGLDAFASCVAYVVDHTDIPLILMSAQPEVMAAGLARAAARRPLIYAATDGNAAGMITLARESHCPLAVHGRSLSETAGLAEQANQAGLEELVLDPGGRGFGPSLTLLTQVRRLALRAGKRSMGYPTIAFPGEATRSIDESVALAGQLIAKYANIVVMDHFESHYAYAFLTARQNIYTDPQRPIQMEPGLYPIREPGRDSPVLVTTNFSLTFFSVAAEVEGSGIPTWLVVCDTDGQSVLTSWAAGKFDGEKIAKAVISAEVGDRVSHRFLMIPGHVATLSGEIEEELPGWSVIVGPREAIDIPSHLKSTWMLKLQEARR